MIRFKLPTHSIETGGIFIPPPGSDDAWDVDLLYADMRAVEARALAEFRDAAEAKYRATHRGREVTPEEVAALRESCELSEDQCSEAHATLPYSRYARGDTRFDIDAPDTDGEGKPCTVASRYLSKNKPSKFYLRRLSPSDYHRADELGDTRERILEFCRLGLRGLDSGDCTWRVGDSEKRVPEAIMQSLQDADVSLPLQIGLAVILYCRKLSKAELFR